MISVFICSSRSSNIWQSYTVLPSKFCLWLLLLLLPIDFFLPLIKPGSNKIIQTTTNKQRILPKDHLLASLLPNCIHVRKSATRLPFNILTVYPLFFQSCVYNTCELLLATLITITMKMNSLANLRKFCNFCLFVWASVFCDSSDSSVFGWTTNAVVTFKYFKVLKTYHRDEFGCHCFFV